MDAFTSAILYHRFTDFEFDYAFRTWENQKGYPVVNVDYTAGSFRLTQERFFEQKSYGVNDSTSFYIPINYATANSPNFETTAITDYFRDTEVVKVITATPGQWYVFNKQQRGYYRVNYNTANWIALRDLLKGANFNQIHVMNRAQLIDDSFALANAGYHQDYELAFDIMSYLKQETDFFPFYPTYRYINNLYTIFGPTNSYLNVSKSYNFYSIYFN